MNISIVSSVKSPRLLYTLNFINAHPLCPTHINIGLNMQGSDLQIKYEIGGNIPRQSFFFSEEVKETYCINTYTFQNQKLFSVEKAIRDEKEFFKNGIYAFDLIETIFFHISRYEEIWADNNNTSSKGWLEEEKHLLVQHHLEKLPVVDHLIKSFFETITKYPVEIKSTFSLSHDIDILYRFKPIFRIPRSLLAIIVHRRGWKHFESTCTQLWKMHFGKAKDPYDTFDFLLRVEKSFTRKCIYLMAGGETRYDNLYALKDQRVENLLKKAKTLGYSIGLHPSINASYKIALYNEEKSALDKLTNSTIVNNRQHWLMWQWPKTPDIISAQNIKEDSSLGYSNRIGFRCGTGFPYHLYNFKAEKAYTWFELPLVYMESSLIHESIRSGKTLKEISNTFLSKNAFNTHIEMNWHNSNFDSSMWYGASLKTIYIELINHLS